MHYIKSASLILAKLLPCTLLLASSLASAQILVDEGDNASQSNSRSNVQINNQSNSEPVYENQNQNNSGNGAVGEGAARQYFRKRETPDSRPMVQSTEPGARYMAIQLGSFVNDTAYRWGENRKEEDVGEIIFGVSYRVGEWVNSADLLARIEYTQYDVNGETAKKLSFMPIISFPDAKSGFPLYFGGGGGIGIFLKQLSDESSLSLDYNIHAGARFMNMFQNGGVLIETGLKGHFHLVGSGQFDGVYVSVGGAFTF